MRTMKTQLTKFTLENSCGCQRGSDNLFVILSLDFPWSFLIQVGFKQRTSIGEDSIVHSTMEGRASNK